MAIHSWLRKAVNGLFKAVLPIKRCSFPALYLLPQAAYIFYFISVWEYLLFEAAGYFTISFSDNVISWPELVESRTDRMSFPEDYLLVMWPENSEKPMWL